MWEFCINITDKDVLISKKIYTELKEFCKNYNGVVTTFERCGKISILISAEQCDESRYKHFISNLISNIICEDYKMKYLMENISLPNLDSVSKNAFIQALLGFDKETDKYIVQKFLVLENALDLESLYYFKLSQLRDKWKELVQIANDNKTYLSSNETLIELLKFLVDNLEPKYESIKILEKNNKICFLDDNYNVLKQNDFSEKDINSTIISSLISLSPKYVNVYCKDSLDDNLLNMLKQIFDKRINFVQIEDNLIKND